MSNEIIRMFSTIKSYLVEITLTFDKNNIIVLQTSIRALSPRGCLETALSTSASFVSRAMRCTNGKLVYNYRLDKVYAYDNESKLVGIYDIGNFDDLVNHITKVEVLGEYDDSDDVPYGLGKHIDRDSGLCSVRYRGLAYAD